MKKSELRNLIREEIQQIVYKRDADVTDHQLRKAKPGDLIVFFRECLDDDGIIIPANSSWQVTSVEGPQGSTVVMTEPTEMNGRKNKFGKVIKKTPNPINRPNF